MLFLKKRKKDPLCSSFTKYKVQIQKKRPPRIILSEVVPPPLHLTCFYHISALMYLHIGWRIHQKPRKERIWTDYKHKNHIRRICRALHGTISSERYPLLTFHHHDVISKTVQWSEWTMIVFVLPLRRTMFKAHVFSLRHRFICGYRVKKRNKMRDVLCR